MIVTALTQQGPDLFCYLKKTRMVVFVFFVSYTIIWDLCHENSEVWDKSRIAGIYL